jgi:hypothetical protein
MKFHLHSSNISIVCMTAAYSIWAFWSMPAKEAFLTLALVALSALVVLKLTRQTNIFQAFVWFKKHIFRGAFVVLLTCIAAVSAMTSSAISLGQVGCQMVLVFMWFWIFAAIGTYFDERRP